MLEEKSVWPPPEGCEFAYSDLRRIHLTVSVVLYTSTGECFCRKMVLIGPLILFSHSILRESHLKLCEEEPRESFVFVRVMICGHTGRFATWWAPCGRKESLCFLVTLHVFFFSHSEGISISWFADTCSSTRHGACLPGHSV